MELKVYKDSVAASETICDIKTELPVETEILIPDYLPQVFKIVKCFARLVVLQKQMSASRVTVDGYLRCVVYYQSDTEHSLCQIEQKVPFTKQAELREGGYSGFDAFVTGETEYLNCRAVNQRRIDIRGAYALAVKVFSRTQQEILTAVADNGMEQKLVSLKGTRVVNVQEKIITAEESIMFDAPPLAVIDTALRFAIHDSKLVSGKAIVKGELIAEVLYRTQEGVNVQKTIKQIPFNEIVDVEGASEDGICFATAEPTGCTLLSSGENNETTLSITALLCVRVLKQAEYLAVGDAFSTKYETVLEKNTVSMETTEDIFLQSVQVTIDGTLPDENVQIIDVKATALPVEAVEENGEVMLRSRIAAHIICLNALGELDCYDKTSEYTLPKHYSTQIENTSALCGAFVNNINVRKSGTEAQVSVSVTVYGLILSKTKYPVVSSVQCGELLQNTNSDIALRIYYAQAGEDVFDIAKRYFASPSAIACANGIEQGVLVTAQQLLIPAAL